MLYKQFLMQVMHPFLLWERDKKREGRKSKNKQSITVTTHMQSEMYFPSEAAFGGWDLYRKYNCFSFCRLQVAYTDLGGRALNDV